LGLDKLKFGQKIKELCDKTLLEHADNLKRYEDKTERIWNYYFEELRKIQFEREGSSLGNAVSGKKENE